ncbi:MAG: Hpt domain-containing protein [Pseudomonadota bacterium]
MARTENGSVEIIPVKIDLRKKAPPLPAFRAKVDPVKAAEAAIDKLSFQFKNWMVAEVENLNKAWRQIKNDGLTEESEEMLYRASHDIKGQAETFGFPLAGQVAASLCKVLEACEDRSQIEISLLEKHVQAMIAIVQEKADEKNPIGNQLVAALHEISEEFVASLQGA